ncbi:hypothetical protein [Bradyrhizobium sp. Rc2d]|uniref:hypothetical protein n=1 Tax=Bradyrhizobium sp. Rc2d TaxID=1855321 RepID=UPI0015A1CF1C|nr:hypothetical protein [Bradyrhizobium sp. Rc2d]
MERDLRHGVISGIEQALRVQRAKRVDATKGDIDVREQSVHLLRPLTVARAVKLIDDEPG